MVHISIGWDCTPRGYMKRYLGISKSNGYKTGPFDLCFTSIESLTKCIETDFVDFFKDLHLIPGNNGEGDRSLAGPGGMNITNAYGIVFNHEGPSHSHLFAEGKNDDEFYTRNDFEQFRKRYATRIQNFKKYIEINDEITLVTTHTDHQILSLFNRVYSSKTFKVLVPSWD